MPRDRRYKLYIGAYSPATIPMARLAEYMADFAALLGAEYRSHFLELQPGSTTLVACVEHEDVPKVAERLDAIRTGTAPEHAERWFKALDDRLASDNATGRIVEEKNGHSAEIFIFPGANRPKQRVIGPVSQEGSLDGILVSIVGADETIHFQLQNGDVKYTGLSAKLDVGVELAQHFRKPVRVYGLGRWLREADGAWTLKSFRVKAFDILRDSSLLDAVESLRAIEGSGWKEFDDPLAELNAIRGKDDEIH